jgi:hypothetical protein
MFAWLSPDRGLLVIGTSLVLGGLGYLWLDCLRLWHVRRRAWDAIDLASTSVFTALILGSALAMHVYDSIPVAALGAMAAALSGFGLRRILRVRST